MMPAALVFAVAFAQEPTSADADKACAEVVEVRYSGEPQHVPGNHIPAVVIFDSVVRDECGMWDAERLGARLAPGRWGVGLSLGFEAEPSGSRIVLLTLGDDSVARYLAPPPDAQAITALYWEFEVPPGEPLILRARVAHTADVPLRLSDTAKPKMWARRITP